MEKHEEWRPVLDAQVKRWTHIPWEQLEHLLQEPEAHEVTFEGRKYHVRVEMHENTDACLHFNVAVDDGASPQSTLALSHNVILSKTRRERRRMAR